MTVDKVSNAANSFSSISWNYLFCACRCVTRFFDQDLAENSRFVHFATSAKICLILLKKDEEVRFIS